MRKLVVLLFVCLALTAQAKISIKQIDPFSKVLPGNTYPAFDLVQPSAYGDNVTVQLLLQSDKAQNFTLKFSSTSIAQSSLAKIVQYRVGYVKAHPEIMGPSEDQLKSATGSFPDPLFKENAFTAQENLPLSIVLDIPVEAELKAGLHAVTIKVISASTKRIIALTVVRLQVFPVAVPLKKMDYTNWYHDVEYKHMNNGKEVVAFSPQYWSIFQNIVSSMKQLGQNTFTINPTYLITFKKDQAGWSADYTNFDKAVAIILKAKMTYVECRQFASRISGWESQFGWVFPKFYSPTEYMMDIRAFDDKQANGFYIWFIKSYYKHLQQKLWLSSVLQHVADEPITANAVSYSQFSAFVKRLAPGLKIIEAVGTMQSQANVDVLVIPLGSLAEFLPEIKRLQKTTEKKVWLYTSIHPQGEYANRFIELPLIKTTLLPWIAAKYNLDGYLHWGLNFWGNKPYENASIVQFAEVYKFPAGDAYLVYPGDQNINPSLRALAMRNGIYDVALLQLLKKKNPAKATEINSVLVKSFDSYDLSTVDYFEQKRYILQLLSGK